MVPDWVRGYRRAWFRDDLPAGLTLAVMLIPQAMAYASLAGMPPISGLYASMVALIVYAWLGSSSQLSVGTVALDSLLVAAALQPLAGGDPGRYVVLAGALAMMVGVMHLALAAVRAGALVELIGQPVIVGFTAAAGLIIAASQLKDLIGVQVPRADGFVDTVAELLGALGGFQATTLAIGGASLVALLGGRRLAPRFPTTLLVVAAAIGITSVLGLDQRGVAVVGEIPAGLPRPRLPDVGWADLRSLLPSAAVIAAVGYAESVSIARSIAARSRERLDTNRELVALGTANLSSGVLGGFSVAASFTRSAIVADSGARTQLAGLIAAATVAATLLVLTPVFEPLPKAVLAAIVLIAVRSLVDLPEVLSTLRVDRTDGLVLLVTFVATLLTGVALGLLIGVVVNLGVHVARGMRPALVEVGRVEGTQLYRSVDRFPTVTDPRGAILRLDGPLDFLSVEAVTGRLLALAADRPELDWLVLEMSGVTGMDSAGVHALHDVQAHLADAEVNLHLATLRGPQRDVIRRAGLFSQLMEGSCHADVPAALAAIGLPEHAPVRHPSDDEPAPDGLW